MLADKKLGFIGAGQMCEAIVAGLLRASVMTAGQISVYDVSAPRMQALAQRYGVAPAESAAGLAAAADIVILSVKPQAARAALAPLAGAFTGQKLAVSIIGGFSLASLQKLLPGAALIRVMPNTAAQVNAGAAGIAAGSLAGEEHLADCKAIFDAVGESYVLDESLIDPLTALSGCGPAFACLFMEALADGGVEQGLPRAIAQRLAAQTLLGAARMAQQSGAHPAQLKDAVCSPGGGTIAGVHALESGGLRAAVMDAVKQARVCMAELGKE